MPGALLGCLPPACDPPPRSRLAVSDVRADGGVGTRLGLCACVVGSFRSWCPRSWFCSRLRPVHVSVHVSVHVPIYAFDHGFFLSFFVERYLSIIHYSPLRRSLSHLSRLPFSFSLSMYAFPRFSDSLAKAICSSTRPAIYVQPRYACMYSIRIAYLYPPPSSVWKFGPCSTSLPPSPSVIGRHALV